MNDIVNIVIVNSKYTVNIQCSIRHERATLKMSVLKSNKRARIRATKRQCATNLLGKYGLAIYQFLRGFVLGERPLVIWEVIISIPVQD